MIVNPGIRRFLGSAIQRLFNSASFYAPLTHSLALERGAGSPTFTRATPATVTDHEGVLRTAIAGEARFEGARRVKNLLATNSENATTDSPLALNASATATVITTTAAGNSYYYKLSNVAIPALGKAIVQLELSGSGSVNITVQPSVSGAGFVKVNLNVVLTSTPTFYDIVVTNNATAQAFYFGIDGRVSEGANAASQLAGTVTVTKWMIEDVTGRTDQTTPSEYVSVGVESAPYYHGSMVDGVKCFPTDLSGNPLTTMLGYSAEGARTNLCLQSNAFTTTWVDAGGTSPDAVQNATGPNGQANYAWTLTDNSAVAYEAKAQTGITFTAGQSGCFSVLVEKKTSGPAYPGIQLNYNVASGIASGIIVNEVAGTIAAFPTGGSVTAPTAMGIETYNDGVKPYWLVWVSNTQAGATATATVFLYPSVSSDGTTLSAAAQGSTVFCDAQFESGTTFPSSRIPTTTAAVTRNADVLTYSGGDVPNLKTLCATFRRESGVSSVGVVVAQSDGGLTETTNLYLNTATEMRSNGTDGGASQWAVVASNAYAPGASSSAALSMATNDIKTSFGGTSGTQDTSATIPTVTQLNVGHMAGSFQLSGNVGGIYGWTRNLSQSELNAITS